MDQVTIRKAVAADLETLLQFQQGVIETERPFDPTLKKEFIQYYDLNEMLTAEHIQLMVAEAAGELIASGYARIQDAKPYQQDPQYAYMGFMYVVPGYRGKGINKLILEALQNWALSRGLKELRLQVYADNLPAIRAYEKVGFSKHLIEMRLNTDDL